MGNKLFIGNISYSSSEESLTEAFSAAGEVTSVKIIIDRMSGRSKGFGFVEMATDEEAAKAKEMFDGKEVDERKLNVDMAKPREESPRGDFNTTPTEATV